MTFDTSPSHEYEPLPEGRHVEYVEKWLLTPQTPVEIDTSRPLLDAVSTYEQTGVDGTLVAGIRAVDITLVVFDTRNSEQYTTPFVVATEEYRHDHSTGYKGVYPDEQIIFGRHHHQKRFHYPPRISRDHFALHYDEKSDRLTIEDCASTNGTRLSAFIVKEDKEVSASYQNIYDKYTNFFVQDVKDEQNYGERDTVAPYGYRFNHPIIGRRSPSVRNGVYGTRESEQVVVDDKSRLLKKVVDDFMATLPTANEAETMSTTGLLNQVCLHVARVLKYDLPGAERLSAPHYGNKGLICLSEYIDQGVGVCRHQALLAAHLIEEVIERGYIEGSVGVERNQDLEANGAHAWAVYKSTTSDDIIVDATQKFVGTRKQAQQRRLWRYSVAKDDD